MHYYNLKIKANNGEYCLDSNDKDITQREMDLYFALMFGASKEFVDGIKKVEKKDIQTKSIYELDNKNSSLTKTPGKEESTNTKPTQQNTSNQSSTSKDDFVKLSNPTVEVKKEEAQTTKEIVFNNTKQQNTSNSLFKPLVSEELVFQNTTKQEEIQKNESLQQNYTQPQTNISFSQLHFSSPNSVSNLKFQNTNNQITTEPTIQAVNSQIKITKEINNQEEITLPAMDITEKVTHPAAQENVVVPTVQIVNEQVAPGVSKEINIPTIQITNETVHPATQEEIVIPTQETIIPSNNIMPVEEESASPTAQEVHGLPVIGIEPTVQQETTQTSTLNNQNVSNYGGLNIIGMEAISTEKPKEATEVKLNQTINLIQDAIKNIDIESDQTFDIDIPDTYKKKNEFDYVQLKEFDKKSESQPTANIQTTALPQQEEISVQPTAQQNSDEIIDFDNDFDTQNDEEEEINSIFSNESPFENPPESQNIIAAKEYQENNQAFNLDFKTFLSNYQTNSIIDDFLICAYYIKHVSGQHSFNMKYINSKIFQATGNIADSSVINGLIEGNFIKVIEVDGIKKYSISSAGEEYFMTHYQR